MGDIVVVRDDPDEVQVLKMFLGCEPVNLKIKIELLKYFRYLSGSVMQE